MKTHFSEFLITVWYIVTVYLMSFSPGEENRPGQSEDFCWDVPWHVSRERAVHAGDSEPAECVWSDPRDWPGGAPYSPESPTGHCLWLIVGLEVGCAGRGDLLFHNFCACGMGLFFFRVWWDVLLTVVWNCVVSCVLSSLVKSARTTRDPEAYL